MKKIIFGSVDHKTDFKSESNSARDDDQQNKIDKKVNVSIFPSFNIWCSCEGFYHYEQFTDGEPMVFLKAC